MVLCPPYEVPALQRLVVIARVVALWRGDVAVLVIIVLDRSALRLLRFVVALFRRLGLPAGSAHVMPFSSDESALLCMPIRSIRMISILSSLAGMLPLTTRTFLPFLRRSVQKGFHTEP